MPYTIKHGPEIEPEGLTMATCAKMKEFGFGINVQEMHSAF
jgi:hypothetical protein